MFSFFKRLFGKLALRTDSTSASGADDEETYFQKSTIEIDSSVEKIFNQPAEPYGHSFIYCLVGNIVERNCQPSEKHYTDTKHFSAGTKVYCYPAEWGDGYEKIKVIGRHRKSKRMVTIITASKYVTNWRLKTVHNPLIVEEMTKNRGWTSREKDKETIIAMAAWLNKRDA